MLPERVPLLAWDLSRGVPGEVYEQVAAFQPEAIYHLGALSVPADCGAAEPTPQAQAVNAEGTQAVLDLARRLDSAPRLLVTSSCYVYAPVTREAPLVTEDSPVGPRSGYGKSKLAAEQAALHGGPRSAVDAVVARAFQHAGPRQSPRMILPDWARQLTRPGDEPIRAVCLDAFLDLSDVRDLVRAYRLLVLHGRRGEVYNVGSGICRRSGDLMETMRRCAGSSREVLELQPGVRQHPIAATAKLQRDTGWTAEIPLEQTVIDTLNYWREKGSEL